MTNLSPAVFLALIQIPLSSVDARADTSGLIPPGYCAIVVASDKEMLGLRSNPVVQALEGRDFWVFQTIKGALSVVIGAAPLDGHEAIIGELLEGGLVGDDAFCMGVDKVEGLAAEPPTSEFPVFAGAIGRVPGQQDFPASDQEHGGQREPKQEMTGKILNEGAFRSVDPDHRVHISLNETHSHNEFVCSADLGRFSNGRDSYYIEATWTPLGWGVAFRGNKPIADDYRMITMGGSEQSPIMLNITYAERDGTWTSRFVNSQPDLFVRYFFDDGQWRDWPQEIIPLSTEPDLRVVLFSERFPEMFDGFKACKEQIEAHYLELRRKQCREDIAWSGPDHPSVQHCGEILAK